MSATRQSGTPLVIAVEGMCFAGKTTLARALARRLSAAVIPEYADLAPLPGFPPASPSAARTALSRFLAIEAGRARSARTANGPLVLFDRCPLTLIAHEHAMTALGIPSDPAAAARWFSSAAAAGAIIAPDGYLHLTTPDETFHARQDQRGPLPAHLVSPAVRAAISGIYKAYFTATSPARVLELDGRTPPPQLAERAARFIANLPGRGIGPPPQWAILAPPSPALPAARTAA